jgi:Tol biopolymer transport system component
VNATSCRKTMAAWLTIALLSSMLTACGTLEIRVERTPTPDHVAATATALATENARLKALLATQQAVPTPAGTVSPTPVATSTPGSSLTLSLQAVADHPPGTRLNQLLHGYESISLGNWSPDGTHLVLYAPAGPLEGNQIPDAEPMIVDVESGAAWHTGDSAPHPYRDWFAWLPDGRVLFVAGGELWQAQADGQDRRLLTEAVADTIIAFSASPDSSTVLARGERQCWLIPADDGVPKAVTDLPGGNGGRSWSPDGTRIALWHKDGTTYLIDPAIATAHPLAETPVVGGWPVPPVWLANSQLFLNAPVYPYNRPALVDLESGAVRDLVSTLGLPEPEHVISQCYPSPDGKYMAITVADLDKFANMNYLWDIVTDQVVEVGPPVDVFGGLWSPTGQQVVVLLGEGDEEVLAVLDVSSGEVRHLAEPAWPPTEWTPDGTRIAFGSPEGEIWIVPADGSGEAKRLLPSLGENPTLQWSPDGRRLAVAVEHWFGPFYEELYVVKLASVAEETPAPAGPDGQLAVLIGGPPLSLVNLAGGPPQTLGGRNMATNSSLFFQWSPDGEEIVYGADADLWLLDAESGESQNLTDNDRWDLMPTWSLDGDWIAFTSRPLLPDESKTDWMKGEWGGALAVIGANGAHFRILDDEGIVMIPPSWAPTGRRLAYAADGELRLYDLDTSERTVLAPSDFNLDAAYLDGPAWSPDGRLIAAYFSRSAELAQWDALGAGTAPDVGQGVVVLDLETQMAAVLFEWEAPFVRALTSLRWQPGGGLLLIDVRAAPRVPQQAGLWLADSASGKVTILPVAAYDADWSPDGRWIAVIDLDDRERLVLVDVEQPTTESTVHRWPYGLEGLAWHPIFEQ